MSGGGGGGQEGQGKDPAGTGVLWILAAIFVLLWGAWTFGHTQIVAGFFYLKQVEISAIQFFVGGLDQLKTYVTTTSPGTVDIQTLSSVANQVGDYLQIPVITILLLLAGVLFFRSSTTRYSETYTMSTFVHKEIKNWPQSMPVIDLDLVHTDVDEGAWAMALTPMMFAKKYQLLTNPTQKYYEDRLKAEMTYHVSVRHERAKQVFVMQLGKLWQGSAALKPHVRALFAVFIARGAQDAHASSELLEQISRSSRTGKLDFSSVDRIIEKYEKLPAVQAVISKHAYELTVMASMLAFARTDGVLSSAEILWLKPVDRRLWFVLNTVGRRVAVPEVAGVYAHWIAEKKLQRSLKMPMIDSAIDALEMAIQEVLYKPV